MHTVIVGGGFAGVKAALEISQRGLGKVTLVSDEKYFLHHATLYATATGRSSAESVIPLSDIFAKHHDVSVVQATMKTIKPDKRVLVTTVSDISYDTLIIAIGMVTSYFGIKGMQQHSYGIKTLEQIHELQKHIKKQVTTGATDKNYVIVGAGPTGVELAGSLGGYIQELEETYVVKHRRTTIHVIEACDRVLPKSSKTASKVTKKQLEKLGVVVHLNAKVTNVDASTIEIGDTSLKSHTIIWTAGVTNNPFFGNHPDVFTLTRPGGQVVVDDYLCAAPNIYVLGDNAATKNGGVAWTALHNAEYIADHLARQLTARPLHPYKPKYFPQSFPIGDNWAYSEWRGMYADGSLGYFARRMIEYRSYRALLSRTLAMAAWKAHDIHSEGIKEQ